MRDGKNKEKTHYISKLRQRYITNIIPFILYKLFINRPLTETRSRYSVVTFKSIFSFFFFVKISCWKKQRQREKIPTTVKTRLRR